jgi:hypothetical protein
MEKICKKCASDPMSHSFKKISEKGGILTYYTQPSQGKLYDDKEGILLHVDNALKLIGNKKWRCIVRSGGCRPLSRGFSDAPPGPRQEHFRGCPCKRVRNQSAGEDVLGR